MSQDARDLNFAVNEVSSMAEQISAGHSAFRYSGFIR